MATRWRLRLPPLDLPLAVAALGLTAIGLLVVFSATSVPGAHHGLWTRQLVWAACALAAAWIVAGIHYRVYDALAWPLYGVSLLLLVLVLVMGSSAMGARRWLDLGPLRFQPSEIAKIATVLALARWFDNPRRDLRRFLHWLPPLLFTLAPFALVAKEPDLGTSLSFPAILVAMYFWAGMPAGQLLLGLTPVFAAGAYLLMRSQPGGQWFVLPVVAAIITLWAVARPRLHAVLVVVLLNVAVCTVLPRVVDHLSVYQLRRIETFLDPQGDRYGAGYQVIQSQIAIGSGGVFGKGYLKGTQKALAFLPMRHTDFIFSVVGEELGLGGALTVVLLYALLVLRGWRLALVARSGFASLLAAGLVTALFYQVLVNMLMTIGWAPVTGLPLPLISYGGTALIVNGIQIGLLQNVALRRQES
ncbi:MAG: rod shape-determining protein RodA [Candidatus Eisenbacteria bacterium]|nr:rod shape-determining protein RodA [Candidatus Eisenbacteria bacterium]